MVSLKGLQVDGFAMTSVRQILELGLFLHANVGIGPRFGLGGQINT
jgi:hypothetical protein